MKVLKASFGASVSGLKRIIKMYSMMTQDTNNQRIPWFNKRRKKDLTLF